MSIREYLKERYRYYLTIPTDFIFDELGIEDRSVDAIIVRKLIMEALDRKSLPREIEATLFFDVVECCL